MKNSVMILLSALPCLVLAEPRVYTVQPFQQSLATPVNSYELSVHDIAIDGDSIIATTRNDAYLFRRGLDGKWTFSKTLTHVDDNGGISSRVQMKNFLAIIKIGALSTIWEKVGGEWVQAPTAAPITGVGDFAISTNRIMVGANGCNFDAYIYEKKASGIWDVTGRIPADDGTCNGREPRSVDLNYDYAVVGTNKTGINIPSKVVRTYRPNGTALLWASAGDITLTGDDAKVSSAPDLQSDTLVIGGVVQYRRTSSGWVRVGTVRPVDFAAGTGKGGFTVYRDGVLLVRDYHYQYGGGSQPYIYVKNSQGTFDHIGVLARANDGINAFDISGDTIVAATTASRGSIDTWINVYKLPADRSRAPAVANNFDAQTLSDFSFSAGSQYTIAGNTYNYLLRQSNRTANTAAILDTSEWTDYQSVEADLRPNAYAGFSSRVGLAVRYIDANNYYAVTVGDDGWIRLQLWLNGAFTTLAQAAYSAPVGTWQKIKLIADEEGVTAYYGGTPVLHSDDASLKHGRVAVLTSGARADFDNLLASSTRGFALLSDELPGDHLDRPYTLFGGNWAVDVSDHYGYRQTDTSGQALAIQGPALQDQSITAGVVLEDFASTNPVAWYGVVARFVDANNFYYLSARSSNQLQIRKVVNGVTTVLKAAAYTTAPGDFQRLTLAVIGNELTAAVNDVVVARAIDSDIQAGRFGLGTYRAAATFPTIDVLQK